MKEKHAKDNGHGRNVEGAKPEFKPTPRPNMVFSKFHSEPANEQQATLCVEEVGTKFSIMDQTMFVTVTLEGNGDSVYVRRGDTNELVQVQWIKQSSKIRVPPAEEFGLPLTIMHVQQQRLKKMDKKDGAVTLSNGWRFKNPGLEKPTLIKCVRLWGTKYRPPVWLSGPEV